MWDIPALASGSVVLPALTHTCTATTGEEWFSRITTVKPLANEYFSINFPPSGAGVAPAATAPNRIHPARNPVDNRLPITFSYFSRKRVRAPKRSKR
jgi:hypothetical protein